MRKNVGSMGKAFHVGNGVRAGLLAAMLARNELKVDPDIIEGSDEVADGHERFGLADTFNGIGNYRLERMVENLGERFELARNTTMVRLHPGSSAPAAAIDGMIDLVTSRDLNEAQVENISLGGAPHLAGELFKYMACAVRGLHSRRDEEMVDSHQDFRDKGGVGSIASPISR